MDPVFEIEATKKREEMMESAKRQLLFDTIKTDMTLNKVQERLEVNVLKSSSPSHLKIVIRIKPMGGELIFDHRRRRW